MTKTHDANPQLSPQEHAKIRDEIISDMLAESEESHGDQVAVILAGQPGAGKSGLKKQAGAELGLSGVPAIIDVDDLRVRHPRYAEFRDEDDLTAAGKTHHDASLWADELRAAGIAGRRNLIIDGTLKDPDAAEQLCEQLREAGYRVEIRALAVRPEDSRLQVYLRYEQARATTGHGRWVPEEVQDEAVERFPESLRRIEQRGLADRIEVYDEWDRIYDNPAAWEGGGDEAARVIEAEHCREPELAVLYDREFGWSQWQESAASNGSLDKPYAKRGLDLQKRAQVASLDAQCEAAIARGERDTPGAQRLFAQRAKVHRESLPAFDTTVPDRSSKGKGLGADQSARRTLDRDDR